jgi:copper chaperone CopZ
MSNECHVIPFNKEASLDDINQGQLIILQVTGMGCIHCAARVHNSLIDHPGVIQANVSHETGCADIIYLPVKVSVKQLIERVTDASDGRHIYRATVFEAGGT